MPKTYLEVTVDLFLAVPIVAEFPVPPVDSTRMRHAYQLHIDQQGDGDIDLLERVFRIFNIDHPSDYFYRSFSAGDVISLDYDRSYVCDAVGWRKLEFVLLYPGAPMKDQAIQRVMVAEELGLELVCTGTDSGEVNNTPVEGANIIHPIESAQRSFWQVSRMNILATLRRLPCLVRGCYLTEEQRCGQCGETFYDGRFVNQGLWDLVPWDRISQLIASARWLVAHRCDHCQEWMFCSNEHLCSQRCDNEWIPF